MTQALAGSPLNIPADVWNDLLQMRAQWQRERLKQNRGAAEPASNPVVVRVRNSSGSDRLVGDVLGIDGPVTELVTDSEAVYLNTSLPFIEQIALEGVTPDADHRSKFVVLLEPIPSGQIGRAAIRGAVWARCQAVTGNTDGMAAYAKDGAHLLELGNSGPSEVLFRPDTDEEGWCIVVLGNATPQVYYGKTDEAIAKGATGTVNRLHGTTEADTGIDDECVNKYTDLEADVDVHYVEVDGTFYLIAGDCNPA